MSGARVSAGSYLVQENGHINARLDTRAISDSITHLLSVHVDNNVAHADGNLNVSMGFRNDLEGNPVSDISIHPAEILFNGKTIHVAPSTVVYEKERITVNDFEILEEEMLLLGIDGVASKGRRTRSGRFSTIPRWKPSWRHLIYQHSRGRSTVVLLSTRRWQIRLSGPKISGSRISGRRPIPSVPFIEGNWDLLKGPFAGCQHKEQQKQLSRSGWIHSDR